MVGVGADAEFGREVGVDADAGEDSAGIVEIGLTLLLGGSERIQNAVAAVDRHGAAAAGEGDRLANPVARVGAGEDRVVEDGVEAGFGVDRKSTRRNSSYSSAARMPSTA